MKKISIWVVGAFVALFALTLLLAPTNALAKKHTRQARGKITALDAAARTVTIQHKKRGASITVKVDESTQLTKNKVKGVTLAKLVIGDKARIKYTRDSLRAKRIRAKSVHAKAHGKLTVVDGQNITLKSKKLGEVTIRVTETTKLMRNGAGAALTDFKIGDRVRAKYDATTLQVFKLKANSK